MNIERYYFGCIMIDGKEFSNDVIVYPDRVFSPWWREEGHILQLKDMKSIFDYNPEIIVVGKGAYGVMQIKEEVIEKAHEEGIEILAENTGEAVKMYNEISQKNKAVAALHLTC